MSAPLEDAVDRTIAPPPINDLKTSPRLLSLDTFRGLVILSMLIVNNLGDGATTGYFWKHADWPEPWLAESFRGWFAHPDPRYFPLLKHCTLADYVMPSFMLIIGLAIPYSVAASVKRNTPRATMWLRAIRRAAMLLLLGWIVVYFRDQFSSQIHREQPFSLHLGLDVLQLLGLGYLAARILYELPTIPRLCTAAILYLWHWSLLRFLPQGDLPAGTFTESHNAVAYAYAHWPIWKHLVFHAGPLTIGWSGLLSVPPAAATILLGTTAGDLLRRTDLPDPAKLKRLAIAGAFLATLGACWALDLPFNKPRWTSCYLLWTSGIDFLAISLLYYLIDSPKKSLPNFVIYPFLVFGSNAIAAYFLSIMAKIIFLNTPRVTYHGEIVSLASAILLTLKHALGQWAGGWTFTLTFIAIWWLVLDQMYRRKIFWKL